MISIIIPVYNRAFNLSCALEALEHQADAPPFQVVIADDGSEENVLDVVRFFEGTLRPRYVRWAHEGFQAGAVRNLGCKVASGDVYLFLDSDIILSPFAIAHYTAFFKANPDAIIAGEYDWLPPLRVEREKVMDLARFGLGAVGKYEPLEVRGYRGYTGEDPRLAIIREAFVSELPCRRIATFLYTGNLLMSRKTFWDLGGFDEQMRGHGGEDCEFGIRAQKAGYSAIFTCRTAGYHLWHPRDQDANKRSLRRNVKYIAEKHNLDEVGLFVWNIGEETGILPKGLTPSV